MTQATRRVPLARPWIDEREEELVLEVLRSGRLSLGPTIDRFEELIAERVGAPYAAAVSSGTAGLHMLVRAAGIGDRQMVRFMPSPVWASWSGLPSRCWGWVNARMFFGSDDGKVFEIHPGYLNDNGQPIKVDVQAGWSAYRTPAQKKFLMVRAYVITDGVPRPRIDMRVDYDTSPPVNYPDVTESRLGSEWDVADWDTADWEVAVRAKTNWQGVVGKGGVGAPRMTALIKNCTFSVTGWDVEYETGSIL